MQSAQLAIHQHLSNLGDISSDRNNFFSSLGYDYDGPVDGHNLELLIEKFNEYKEIEKKFT